MIVVTSFHIHTRLKQVLAEASGRLFLAAIPLLYSSLLNISKLYYANSILL